MADEEPRQPAKPDEPPAVSVLLARIRAGEAGAVDALLPQVYNELHALAESFFRAQPNRGSGHTLQPTALVHEAWMKLDGCGGGAGGAGGGGGMARIEDRTHFFRVAARAMRQVLADHAKAKRREKRGGPEARRLSLSADLATPNIDGAMQDFDVVAFDDCLSALAALNPRHAEVVGLRLFGALTIEETAAALGVSHGTVESDWRMAKAWLRRELAGG